MSNMPEKFEAALAWAVTVFDALPDAMKADPDAVHACITAGGIANGHDGTPLIWVRGEMVRRSYALRDGVTA